MTIAEYLVKLDAQLQEIAPIIISSSIQREIDANLGMGFIKGRITFVDGSTLEFSEQLPVERTRFRFHLYFRLFLDPNPNLTTTYCVGATLDTQDGLESIFPRCSKIIFCGTDHKMLYSLIREYTRNLSERGVHYMGAENNLIARWDSAPHHRKLWTFPFHLHTPQGVEEHPAITLLEVLDKIKVMIQLQESQP